MASPQEKPLTGSGGKMYINWWLKHYLTLILNLWLSELKHLRIKVVHVVPGAQRMKEGPAGNLILQNFINIPWGSTPGRKLKFSKAHSWNCGQNVKRAWTLMAKACFAPPILSVSLTKISHTLEQGRQRQNSYGSNIEFLVTIQKSFLFTQAPLLKHHSAVLIIHIIISFWYFILKHIMWLHIWCISSLVHHCTMPLSTQLETSKVVKSNGLFFA